MRLKKTVLHSAITGIILILILLPSCYLNEHEIRKPRAVGGMLDLAEWDFKINGPVRLDGQWEFLWQEHILPENLQQDKKPDRQSFIYVPGAWNNHLVNGNKIPGKGYATYRLKILLGDNRKPLAFKFLDMASSYSVYINGTKLTSSGTPGKTFETTLPKYFPKVVEFIPGSDQLEVIILVSNFHHRQGGVWETIRLGLVDDMRELRERALLFNIFLFGSILIMGLYHICLFVLRKSEKSPLYFSIFCLLIAIRILTTGERYLIQLFPNFNWELALKIEYLSYYLAVPVFSMFIRPLFKQEISRKSIYLINAVSYLFSGVVIFTPARIYSYTTPAFQIFTVLCFCYLIYAVIRASINRREGALMFLLGFFILFITTLNDILYSRQIIQTGHFFPAGLFAFIFSQAFILSLRFSKSFSTVEIQRLELEKTNIAREKQIRERKNAEKALKESEEKYRTLFKDSLEAMSLTQDGIIIDVNPAWLSMHGYNHKKDVIKTEIIKYIHPEDHKVIKGRRKQWPNIENRVYQMRDICKDGAVIDVEIYSSTIILGGKHAILATIRDITQQKLEEAERERLEVRLRRAQNMEAVGTLAGGVAHDLNNILAGLVGYPELLLLELPQDSPLRETLRTIQNSGERAAAMVQDLLTLARRGVAVTQVVNLNLIISDYLKSPEFEKLISFHPAVQVVTHLEEGLLNIVGSPIHLRKTVMNLVSNAAEAMPEGGNIIISTNNQYIEYPIRDFDGLEEGDYVTLFVSDTGSGISLKDRKMIFEPFYTKKTMGRSGTGLGMTVVWGTVKDHKGHIDIKSTEGKGTIFTLYFPATRKELVRDPSDSHIENYMGNGESILVVDDMKEQRLIASKLLSKLNYSVTTVSSGEEAVEYMKKNSADLLVLDMIMDGGMNGLETYKRILELHPGQKAIITSGYAETSSVREAQKLGAGAYVKKPYVLKNIGMAVKVELRDLVT